MDRTNIIRNRIADLRSEKYAYLAEYVSDGENSYEYPETEVADEWNDLLNYLENQVLHDGLEYNVAEEQKRIDFAKIYTGESLREYIYSIPDPEEGDKAVGDLTDYLNFRLESQHYYDGTPMINRLCFVHDDFIRPALPVIAKCIRDQGEEELYRSALIVLDFDRVLKDCIEDRNKYIESVMLGTLRNKLEDLKYYGYDRIYLHNIGALGEAFEGWNLYHFLRIPLLYLGVRIVLSGPFSFFIEYVIQQYDMYDEQRYGDIIIPKKLSKYRKPLRAEELPQLTPEEARRVEDVVLSAAREVFFTDEMLTYHSLRDPWWNGQSKYATRLKVNTSRIRTWQFPEWMPKLIEFYILDALLQSACDSPEDRERVAAWKDAALESLPEAFRENTFTEDPYNDPICEIILVSTGVISSLWNDDMKNCVYYVPIPEVAAYYMHLDRYRSAS